MTAWPIREYRTLFSLLLQSCALCALGLMCLVPAAASNSSNLMEEPTLEGGTLNPLTIGSAFVQQAYLKASNASSDDFFGDSVAISGNTVVVGAPAEGGEGAAYVFVLEATGSWSQQAYLKASNADNGDFFGISVAVSGDTVVVGASQEDSSATGVNGDQGNNSANQSGSAYVFVRDGAGTWSQQAYLKASNTDADDRFGRAVAVSGDTVVVGATQEGSNATGVNGDQSNNSSATAGAAYVFVRSSSTWSQQAYIKASNTDSFDAFGSSVAVSSDTVVIGAVEENSNATGVDGDQSDNSFLSSGAAYVFARDGAGDWSQQAYLKASNTGQADNFGSSVAVSDNTVVVGAREEESNATGVNGDQSDNSAMSSGAAYVFVSSGSDWSQQAYLKASNTDGGDDFGNSVAVSGDMLVVGARYEDSNAIGVNGGQGDNSFIEAGAAYLFERAGTTWSQQAYLKASNTDSIDRFGRSVGVSGATVVVGASNEDSSATGVDGDQDDNSANSSGASYTFDNSFTIGGDVSGLAGSGLLLQNNGGDDLPISANGPFSFPSALPNGSSYEVTVQDQPTGPSQSCSVTNASGTLGGANVTDVAVSCTTDQFMVGGTVTGLLGDQVVIRNNGGDDQVITADGGFAFSPQADGSNYEITVFTQPGDPSQTCSVVNGTGTLAGADITNVEVSCTTDQFTVGGTVSGLEGDQVILQNNGGDDQVLNADGGFSFTAQNDGSNYEITVLTQPVNPIQTCTVTNGSGVLNGANVTDVLIDCVNEPSEIGLSSGALDFGNLISGETSSASFTVTNTGTGELVISELVEPDEPFAVTGGTCTVLPVTLLPGETCAIEVAFLTTVALGDFSDELGIISNSATSPDAVSLSGSVQPQPLPVPGLNRYGLLLLMLVIAGVAWGVGRPGGR